MWGYSGKSNKCFTCPFIKIDACIFVDGVVAELFILKVGSFQNYRMKSYENAGNGQVE